MRDVAANVGAMRLRRIGCGVLLLVGVLAGAARLEAHPTRPTAAVVVEPAEVATAAPLPVEALPAASLTRGPAAAPVWPWLALLLVPALAAPRRGRWRVDRGRRGLAAALGLLLAVFACETAVHSVHHLAEPAAGERCPGYAASQHVSGLSAAPATPDLPPLARLAGAAAAAAEPLVSQISAGAHCRAPPRLPA